LTSARVYPFVSRFVFVCFVVAVSAAAPPDSKLDSKLEGALHGVENRYNRVQSLRLDFSETYHVARRPTQEERGVLFLRKPGKMRWDYVAPAGKVFLSDGKNVMLYTPGNNRLERSKLKESEDLRAPLAFLLGKLNFAKEFRSFTSRQEGDSTWVTAAPASEQAAYTQVEFLISPSSEIRRVRVTGQDLSTLEFTFTNEQLNAPVIPSMFAFIPPPGTQIVEERDSIEARQ
jgi:outer membrane lipoprotein carrier protein